jgi:hypothetical protein
MLAPRHTARLQLSSGECVETVDPTFQHAHVGVSLNPEPGRVAHSAFHPK